MSTLRLPRPPRGRIPALAAVMTLVAVVLTAGAPEPIALVSGVTGTGTGLVRRAPGGTEPLVAGIRLLAGDFLEARGGPVTVTLFDLGDNGLVTVPMVADAPVEAAKALKAEKPTILGGFWSGLKSLVAGDATSTQRFGGAMAGQTSEPAPSKALDKRQEIMTADAGRMKTTALRRLSAVRSAASGTVQAEAKADDAFGGAGGSASSDNESFESDRNAAILRETLGSATGGGPSPSSGVAPQTVADRDTRLPADEEPREESTDDAFGGDDLADDTGRAAAGLGAEPSPEPPAPSGSGEAKKKVRPSMAAPAVGGPFELPDRSGHLVPLGVVRLEVHPDPSVQTLTLQVRRELPVRKDLLKEPLPIGRDADGRPRAVATMDLKRLGLTAGDVVHLQARDERGRFRLTRWYAVGTAEDVQNLNALIARARGQQVPQARQALLLLAAEAAVALNAPTTARELYHDLMTQPGLSEQDKAAFGSASDFLRRAAPSPHR